MLKQLGLVELISAIQEKVEQNTGMRCYDYVKDNTPSPFYFVEVVAKEPANSKTMYRDIFSVWIHAIAVPDDSSVGIYGLIQKLEEALTEDISLPEQFNLILQNNEGIQTIKTDETDEKHAVLGYNFMIAYGYRCKL